MQTSIRFRIQFGLAILLGLFVSTTPFFAQAGRGAAPRGGAAPQNSGDAGARGGRGNSNDVAQARQQIQANKKAAIDSANAMYRLAVTTAQHEAKSGDPGAQARLQSEMKLAESNRKSAVERANANAKAALAALNAK